VVAGTACTGCAVTGSVDQFCAVAPFAGKALSRLTELRPYGSQNIQEFAERASAKLYVKTLGCSVADLSPAD
jgi:hypothetical protein